MSNSMKVEWGPGLQKLLAKLKGRPDAMRKAVGPALFMEAEETMADSKPLVPVLHGFLVGSGHAQLPVMDGDAISVTFGYGGVAGSGNLGGSNEQDCGYAVPVHEDMTKYHPTGQAKYLEVPLNYRKEGMSDRLAGRIQERLPQ